MALKSDSLNTAIELEEKGYNYYTENAKKAQNKFTKQVFESLAEQELQHKKRFQELAQGNDISAADLDNEDMEERIKGIFEESTEAEKKEWIEEEAEVYEQALEMEKKTYNLYKDMAASTDNDQEKEFLEALMEEESKHEESLQNILYYITDHGWWLADTESETWNWMNI